MKSVTLKLVLLGLFWIGVTTATSALADGHEGHRIPDAPAEWLAKTNPYKVDEVDAKFIKKTGRLFKRKCAKCHGIKGDGQGYKAEFFTIKPAAFANPGYMAGRQDGQLAWIITKGSPDTEMKPFGPESDVGLKEDEIWRLITFLRKSFTN
ncbi:MAG: cytochrome c [Magnetococcales bacterium]|nr:cytochrome c [Magnetococcales bacterium]